MEVQPEPKFKELTSYDFTFNNGFRIPISLDASLGDSIEELEDRFVLNLVEKPSPSDPSEKMAAEVATVYKSHLLTVVVQHRKQRIPTPEEQLEFKNTLKSLVKMPKVLQ